MRKSNGLLWAPGMWSDHINRIESAVRKHEDLFANKPEILYWPPGWHHVVVDMLRKIEESEDPVEIIRIKDHYGHIQVHYRSYDPCEKTERIIARAKQVMENTCCICGSFLKEELGCPTHG